MLPPSPSGKVEAMDIDERDALVQGLGPTEQRIYAQLEAGKLSSTELRQATGRADGMTTELRRLMAHGLIRLAGRAPRERGIPPRMYERVPLAEVEAEVEKYAARRPTRRSRSAASKLTEMRRREAGEFSGWHRTRKRILEETHLLTQLETMAFWEAVPEDELELVLDEVLELNEWANAAIEAIEERKMDDSTRAKIEKLRATRGRTDAEIETAHRKVESLSAKLIPSK
jgi:hypothetical protein